MTTTLACDQCESRFVSDDDWRTMEGNTLCPGMPHSIVMTGIETTCHGVLREAVGSRQNWEPFRDAWISGWLACMKTMRRRFDHQPMDPQNQMVMARRDFDRPAGTPVEPDPQLKIGGNRDDS